MPDGPGDVEQRRHLLADAIRLADLDRVDHAEPMLLAASLEQRRGEGSVRIHAIEAVVPGRDGRGEHLPVGSLEGRAGERVDEELVGEATEMDAEAGRQPDRGEDARSVGQAADDRLLLRAPNALVITCHGSVPLRACSRSNSAQVS